MAHDAGDEKNVKDLEKKAAIQRTQELEDVKDILSRPSGVRFFKRMFTQGKMFSTTFTGNSTGFFLEGGRNFALPYLHDVAQVMPHKLIELIIEKAE